MSNDKRQTAVSWYIEQSNLLAKQVIHLSISDLQNKSEQIEKQAKAMMREQIIQARLSLDQTNNIWDKEIFSNMAEQYYNETYKQENE
jgi:hypothetical protein